MKNRIYYILFFFCTLSIPSWAQQQKVDKKILYVGHSPLEESPTYSSHISGHYQKEFFYEEIKTRMEEFKQLLDEYFTYVTTIDARYYTEELSKEYHVTIFDALPPAIANAKDVFSDKGKFLYTDPIRYLSPQYDAATIFIGHTGGIMRAGLGLNIDWYCLCLNNFALKLNHKHDVFNKPFKTTITIEKCDTPLPAYNYLSGLSLPAQVDMWRVQTRGYRDGKNYRIGLVAYGDNFIESLDSEFISGGESLKSIDAAAIARHGNFMLWGFAAPPSMLTPESRVVLANSIDYIAQFAGQKPIVRKIDKTAVTLSSYVDQLLYALSKKGYAAYVSQKKLIAANTESQKQQYLKLQMGKVETVDDKIMSSKFKAPTVLSEKEYYKKLLTPELYNYYLKSRTECINYIKSTRRYFYGKGTYETYVIDADAQSLKIANNDVRLLDKAITLLEQNSNVELAKRLLTRYTDNNFDDAKEWRNWYEANKNELFFSQTSGYVFLVPSSVNIDNNLQPNSVALDKKVIIMVEQIKQQAESFVRINFNITPGFHIYGTLKEGTPFMSTTIKIVPSGGAKLVGDIIKPQEILHNGGGDGIMIYQGESFDFKQAIAEGGGKLKIIIEYQCCDATVCLPPEREEFEIELK